MIKLLTNLKKNLESNWTYIHKILFTFTFYLIYKVFVRAIGFDEMKPYSLIFIIIGFLVFTMDSWAGRLLDFLKIFSGDNPTKKRAGQAILVTAFLFLMILFSVIYYESGYYPYVSLSIFSGITAILASYYHLQYSPDSINKISKWAILILFLPGIAGTIHSFYYNDVLNIYNFIYIIGFFIIENRLFSWRKKSSE